MQWIIRMLFNWGWSSVTGWRIYNAERVTWYSYYFEPYSIPLVGNRPGNRRLSPCLSPMGHDCGIWNNLGCLCSAQILSYWISSSRHCANIAILSNADPRPCLTWCGGRVQIECQLNPYRALLRWSPIRHFIGIIIITITLRTRTQSSRFSNMTARIAMGFRD